MISVGAVLIGCCVFRLLSSQPPVCTGDQPSSLAFQLTSDFHRRSIFLRCLPTQLPTLIGCQILRSAFRSISGLRLQLIFRLNLPVNLRLASPINLPVPPSHRPATCAACRSSGRLSDCSPACAFDQSSAKLSSQSFDSRLRSTFQFRLCIDLRLAPLADPPACLPTDFQLPPSVRLPASPTNLTSDSHRVLHSPAASNRPATCAADRFSSFAFVPTFGFRLWSTFRLYLPASLRLSPSANLPASAFEPNLRLPSAAGFNGRLPNRSATCAAYRSSGFAFMPTFGLRLWLTFRLCLSPNL